MVPDWVRSDTGEGCDRRSYWNPKGFAVMGTRDADFNGGKSR